MMEYGVDSAGLGYRKVVGSFKHGNKTLGFHKMLKKS